MNNPTPHELAAAREIIDTHWNKFPAVSNTLHDELASIIAKHRSEEVKELQRKARALDWLERNIEYINLYKTNLGFGFIHHNENIKGTMGHNTLVEMVERAMKGQQ